MIRGELPADWRPPRIDLRPWGPSEGYRTRVVVSFILRGMWHPWVEASSLMIRRKAHRERAVLRVPLFVDGVRARDISRDWCWALSIPVVAPSLAYLTVDGGASITATVDGDADVEDVCIPPRGWQPSPIGDTGGSPDVAYPYMPPSGREADDVAEVWAWARGRRIEIHTRRPEPGSPRS